MFLDAAAVHDQIHFIGWDVAVTENGSLIIECNRRSGFDLPQVITKRGMKDMLDNLIKEVERLENEG